MTAQEIGFTDSEYSDFIDGIEEIRSIASNETELLEMVYNSQTGKYLYVELMRINGIWTLDKVERITKANYIEKEEYYNMLNLQNQSN